MSFYEGRKIEVGTKCKECGEDIVWYYIFAQNANNRSYITQVIAIEENVSSANVKILTKKENEIDVQVDFRCRFCDEPHEFIGTVYEEDGELKFRQ